MTSVIYPQFSAALAQGSLDYANGQFRAMLVYEDASSMTDIINVQACEIDGAGYVSGGLPVEAPVRGAEITLGGARIHLSSIRATGVVYYHLPVRLIAHVKFVETVV